MKVQIRKQRGFTLIELVLVIAILGVLAVAALPQLFGVSLETARSNAMKATAAAVQTGFSLYAAAELSEGRSETYPTTLDAVTGAAAPASTLASGIAPFFTEVLQSGVSQQWLKISNTCYVFDNNGNGTAETNPTDLYYEANFTDGSFLAVTTCS